MAARKVFAVAALPSASFAGLAGSGRFRRQRRVRPFPRPSVPAEPFLAEGGCSVPEIALSLRERSQVQKMQKVLRRVIREALRS